MLLLDIYSSLIHGEVEFVCVYRFIGLTMELLTLRGSQLAQW